MNVTLIGEGQTCRFILEGRLTIEFARELKARIVEVTRRYSEFEIDLSGVSEIDLCGVHVLGMLCSAEGKPATVVAPSPLVDQATMDLLAAGRCAQPANCPRREIPLRSLRNKAATPAVFAPA